MIYDLVVIGCLLFLGIWGGSYWLKVIFNPEPKPDHSQKGESR